MQATNSTSSQTCKYLVRTDRGYIGGFGFPVKNKKLAARFYSEDEARSAAERQADTFLELVKVAK